LLSTVNEDGAIITTQVYPNSAAPTIYGAIVPINVYNVREGQMRSALSECDVDTRGMRLNDYFRARGAPLRRRHLEDNGRGRKAFAGERATPSTPPPGNGKG
jgi:hypothetical protein